MKKLLYLILFLPVLCWGQSETHNFILVDTTFSSTFGLGESWTAAIWRPANLFTAGSPDTAARPVIVMIQGDGQFGTASYANLSIFGPMYWLPNGWDGHVTLGNGIHYPIIITLNAASNTYPDPYQLYPVLQYILQNYHVKPGCFYGTGLSYGSFLTSGMIEYEKILGDQLGMKIFNALADFEGTPLTPWASWPATPSYGTTNWSDTVFFKQWAKTYHGKYFYLEGSGADNFRDGWHYAQAMNDTVPGSAYFSYENIGGGAHCCWNTMYDPSQTNWTSVGTLGPNNAPSQLGTNTMGDYTGGNIYQWLLRQGDTSIVGAAPATPAPVNTGFFAFIPTASQRIHAGDSVQVVATLVTDNQVDTISWLPGSPVTITPTLTRIGSTAYSSFWLSGLTPGVYTFNAMGTSASGGKGYVSDTITVIPAVVCPAPRTVTSFTIPVLGQYLTIPAASLPAGAIIFNDGSNQ